VVSITIFTSAEKVIFLQLSECVYVCVCVCVCVHKICKKIMNRC